MAFSLFLSLLPGAMAASLSVFTSVVPLASFVARVGGEHVTARSLVRPGDSPHSFEPAPADVGALARADLFVRVGLPFEDAWMKRIHATNPDMAVLDARSGIELRPLEGHTHDAGHHDHQYGDGMDPHVWTDPLLARHMVEVIRDELVRLDPAHGADYRTNAATFAGELEALNRELSETLAPVRGRAFLVFHPAWGYFAARYQLRQLAIERQGKEPGPKSLAGITGQARRENILVVLVAPQFDSRLANRVAQAIGGRVETADPLAADYVANLRRVGRIIAGANQP